MADKSMRKAAFFDLDLTLTRKDSFRAFVNWFYLTRIQAWKWLPWLAVRAGMRKMGLISHAAFVETMLAGLSGLSQGQLQDLGQQFFAARLKALLRPEALERISWHQARGDRVFILTGAPDIYVSALCRYLDLDGYACTRLAMDQGYFSGRIAGQVCLGMEKGRQLVALSQAQALDLKASMAYSDHESDLPLFVRVGHRTAVTPTSALARIAQARGWPVLIW